MSDFFDDDFIFDDPDFDDFGDLDDFFGGDDKPSSPFSSRVEEYYILALADESTLPTTLSRIIKLGNHQQKRKVLGQLIEKWATSGDYRSAISGAILSDKFDDDKWFTIAKIALDHDDMPALQTAIRQHRAKQATTTMTMILCMELLTRQDARARDVWDDFITQVRDLRPTVGKGHILMVANAAILLVGLPDEEAKLASQLITIIRQDELEPSHYQDYILSLQFASTLFDKSTVQAFYVLCVAYQYAMFSSRLKESGIFGDFKDTFENTGGYAALFAVFHLRQYDFINLWINLYRQLHPDAVETGYQLTFYRALFWGFIQQPSRMKRILLMIEWIDSYGRGDLMSKVYPIFNALADLLATVPHQISHFGIPFQKTNDFFFGMDDISRAHELANIMNQAFMALPFLYPKPNDRRPSHLAKLIQFNPNVSVQIRLEALLHYAMVLAVTDDPLFDEALTEGIRWEESAEEELGGFVKPKSNASVPIELLGKILMIFLAQADLPRAEAYLKRLSPKVVWYVVETVINTSDLDTEKPESVDDQLWADITQIKHNTLQTLPKLINSLIQTHTTGQANQPLAKILRGLHENGMEQEATRLSEMTADATLKSIVSGEADYDLAYETEYALNSRRALKLAKEGSPHAKTVFDEVIHQARIDQTKGIKKPQGETLVQLVAIITQANPIDSILTQLRDLPRHYQRQRDKILLEIVRNLVKANLLEDAKRAVALMTVIPIKIQAQTILAEALTSNQQGEVVIEWIHHADGRMNQFWLRCAYALGLLKMGHADAQQAVQTALAIIPKLPRPSFMAIAWSFYACGLVKIGHAEMNRAIEQALSAIRATPDMTSRFYTALDMLAVLLEYNHPMSASVLAYLKTVLGENAESGLMAIGTPIWEISARLDLAKLLFRHGQSAEADVLIQQASEYQAKTRYMAWDMAVSFASIGNPATIKTHLDDLGALPLNQILELMLAWGDVFDQLENGLAHKIAQHMLRLFGWIGYEVGDLGYLAKS